MSVFLGGVEEEGVRISSDSLFITISSTPTTFKSLILILTVSVWGVFMTAIFHRITEQPKSEGTSEKSADPAFLIRSF